MIQAFSLIFNFFNKASPCGDMANRKKVRKGRFIYTFNPANEKPYVVMHISKHFSIVILSESIKFVVPPK
jgi:hypothetical protein